jgi:predicted RNA-binding protein with PIN domain
MAERPHIIIDGYNFVLRQYSIDFTNEHALWDAREKLVHQMIAYLGQKQIRITIVFDGQDLKGISEKHRPAGISVRFSKAPQKADPLILEIIRKSNAKKNITLVTSDRPLARLAAGYGCETIGVSEFEQKMVRKQQKFEHTEKYNANLSPKEIEEWLKIFENGKED